MKTRSKTKQVDLLTTEAKPPEDAGIHSLH